MNRKITPNIQGLETLQKKFVNIKEATQLTNYSRPQIYRKIRDGVFKTKKIGKKKGQLLELDSIRQYVYKLVF